VALDPKARYGTGAYFGQKDVGKGWQPCTASEMAELRGQTSERQNLITTTTPSIAGYHVVETPGIVTGTGHVASTSVSQRKGGEVTLRNNALENCIDAMRNEAVALGANAIVSVQVNAVSGNVGGATIGTAAGRGDVVTVFGVGTAVKITQDQES